VFEIFETNELLIRKIEISDADVIFDKWAQEIEVARYTTWLTHSSVQDTQQYVKSCVDGWSHNSYTWTIEHKLDADIVGSFAARVNHHKIDIGYLLATNWWGKGVMTTAVASFINNAFELNGIERIGAVCDVENLASKRVMEKAGMHYEGVLSAWMVHPNTGPSARDCHSSSISRSQYYPKL